MHILARKSHSLLTGTFEDIRFIQLVLLNRLNIGHTKFRLG